MPRESSDSGINKPTARRRARGTGSLFYSPARGVWVGRVPVGRRQDGSTLYREVSATKQKECTLRMRSIAPPDDGTTVAEWSARWLDSLMVRPPTRTNYEVSVRLRINPVLGHVPIRSVTSYHVELAVKEWSRSLSANTVRLTLAHLSILFRAACRAGLVPVSPVSSARRPKREREKVEPFTASDLSRIIAACTTPEARPVALLAATGMRMGEVLALDAGDYSPATGLLRITKGDIQQHGIGPPKSQNSVRTIRVPAVVRSMLASARGMRDTGRLFVVDGKPVGRDRVYREWKRVLVKCGLPNRNPHQLRHSVASQLLASGAPIADVAAYLGDRPETLYRTYTHATGTDPSASLDRMLTPPVPARKRAANGRAV